MKKRVRSLLLALTLSLSVLPAAVLANDFPFVDVSTEAWYYKDVMIAQRDGLINGKTDTAFEPDSDLTYAEAVKLAACMNQRYTEGSVTLGNGEPWYQSYVDYCKANKIISVDYDWSANATRAGYMEIFANALPDSALKQINEVADDAIADVPMSHPQAEGIYKLYRAGILQGNDDRHNCSPGSGIKRAEVAAILTRMMNADSRISFTLDEPQETEPCEQPLPENGALKLGKGSGVELTVKSTQTEDSALVRVYDANDTVVGQIFIRPGKSADLKLGSGTYTIKAAFGTHWYGENDLFGEEGTYTLLMNGADKTFVFERNYAYTLTLGGVIDGNVGSVSIGGADGM